MEGCFDSNEGRKTDFQGSNAAAREIDVDQAKIKPVATSLLPPLRETRHSLVGVQFCKDIDVQIPCFVVSIQNTLYCTIIMYLPNVR